MQFEIYRVRLCNFTDSDGQPVAGGVSDGYLYDVFDDESRTLMFNNVLQHYFLEDRIQVNTTTACITTIGDLC